ncbi:hypothetical protein L1049_028457 [Liquidambar formosana]|uniref:Uncharacterized protein n=1 Tax=Liquidambar formosana TaxID=63359 RepID=A0AAP0RIZ4_LIQFO
MGDFVSRGGSGEGDDGFSESNLVSDFGVGTQWVGRRNGNTEGQEREIQNRDVEGGRAENEGCVAFGERRRRLERKREGMNLAEEFGVGEAAFGGGIDEDGGGLQRSGGGVKKRKRVVDEREGLGGRRKWDRWTEAVESSCLRAEAVAGID